MKKRYTILTIIVIVLVIFAFYAFSPDAHNKFKWNDFKDGLNLAKRNNKKILINVYTDWCKWCKKMESEVYANEDVKKFIEKYFVPVKFNGESTEKITYKRQIFSHSEFTAAFDIDGFPATIFLTSTAEPITVLPGYHNVKEYLQILKFIGEDYYLKMSYEKYLELISK